MTSIPIFEIVDAFINDISDATIRSLFITDLTTKKDLLEAVYAFCLGLENHHYLDRKMKGIGIDIESQRNLKHTLKYNHYAKHHFWRGVITRIRGYPVQVVLDKYHVSEADIEMCFDCLTDDQYIRLMQSAVFKSTYRSSNTVLDAVIKKATSYCKKVADRQLRWIEKVDPGFCGEEELCDEAIRVTFHYAHFPDSSRIYSYVVRAIHNRANHLCEFHSAECRRRQRKLPELKCNTCRSEYDHQKKTLSFTQAVAKDLPAADSSSFYCPCCAKKKELSKLEVIENDRIYETMVISIDSQMDDEGRSLGETIPDHRCDVEKTVQYNLDMKAITKKLDKESAEFVRILCNGDRDFEKWAIDQGVKSLDNLKTVAYMICDYKGIRYEKVKRNVGMVIGKPSVFVVMVDGEKDMICAQTPWDAVQGIAKHYKFSNGYDMEDSLGKILVKKIEGNNKYFEPGEIFPVLE